MESNRQSVVCEERELEYKHSRVLAVKLVLLTFFLKKGIEVHSFSNRQQNHFKVPIENGGTKNQKLIDLSKEMWAYLCSWGITTAAEYLTSVTSTQAFFQTRDHSESKLNPEFFLKVSLIFGKPVIDLFASRLSRQVPEYTTWMPDLSLQKKWKLQIWFYLLEKSLMENFTFVQCI